MRRAAGFDCSTYEDIIVWGQLIWYRFHNSTVIFFSSNNICNSENFWAKNDFQIYDGNDDTIIIMLDVILDWK